jgi:hypothetical protein
MNLSTKVDFSFYVLAADIGVLIPINYINIVILTQGGVILFENNPLIIAAEVVGTIALTAINVAWLLNKFKFLAKKKKYGILQKK